MLPLTGPATTQVGVLVCALVCVSVYALAWPSPASALRRDDAERCATQTETIAAARIAACGRLLSSRRLRGKPLGVAYAMRGLAYLDRGDIPHAIGDLNRAIELAPDFAPAYQNRGNAWYARGSYGQALADYDKTIGLDPDRPSPYVNRATVRRDLGLIDGALADYQKAIALRPDHAPTYRGRGQLYMRQHDYARAIADFDTAIRLDPSADNYLSRAQAREAAGDLNAALADAEQAGRFDPKSIAPLRMQAALWRRKGDLGKSIAALDRAIRLNDDAALIYRLRAQAYRDLGDRNKAAADIGRSLKLSWTVAGLNLRGHLRLDDGDADGALHDALAMLKIEADNSDAIALRGMAKAALQAPAKDQPQHALAVAGTPQGERPTTAKIEPIPEASDVLPKPEAMPKPDAPAPAIEAAVTPLPTAKPAMPAEQMAKPTAMPMTKPRDTARDRVQRQAQRQIQRHEMARREAEQRAAEQAHERYLAMSPSEQRRAYFDYLQRRQRVEGRRETTFSDIWR